MTPAVLDRPRCDRAAVLSDFASSDSGLSWMIPDRCGQGGHLVRGPHAAPAAPFLHRGDSRREAAVCPQDDEDDAGAASSPVGEAKHGIPLQEALREYVPAELTDRVDAADKQRALLKAKGLDAAPGYDPQLFTHRREQTEAHRSRNAAFRDRCFAGELVVSWCSPRGYVWTAWPPEAWQYPDILELMTIKHPPLVRDRSQRLVATHSRVRVLLRADAAPPKTAERPSAGERPFRISDAELLEAMLRPEVVGLKRDDLFAFAREHLPSLSNNHFDKQIMPRFRAMADERGLLRRRRGRKTIED